MLYKFKSKATADLIMLEPNGRRLLELIGKADALARGIVPPAQMPAAIAALEAAIAREEAAHKTALDEAAARGEEPPLLAGVSLRQRAAPLIEMLRRCQKANEDLVWGV